MPTQGTGDPATNVAVGRSLASSTAERAAVMTAKVLLRRADRFK
jgi:hypothetical protein